MNGFKVLQRVALFFLLFYVGVDVSRRWANYKARPGYEQSDVMSFFLLKGGFTYPILVAILGAVFIPSRWLF